MTQAQLAQARFAIAEYTRQEELRAQGFVSQARVDAARSARQQSRQRVAELEAAVRVARLPAREDTRSAAEAQAQAARQALRQAEWRAQQKAQRAPADAVVATVDATDPSASSNAIAALAEVAGLALRTELTGPLLALQPGPDPFEIRVHRRYNPEGLSRYNIVPGLIGTILAMTMVMLTGFGHDPRARAGNHGKPAGHAGAAGGGDARQDPVLHRHRVRAVGVILLAAWLLFEVPMAGSFCS